MKKLILSALLLIAPLKATFDHIPTDGLMDKHIDLFSFYELCKHFTVEHNFNPTYQTMSIAYSQEQISAMQRMFGQDWASKINTDKEDKPSADDIIKIFEGTFIEDRVSIIRWGIKHRFPTVNTLARDALGLTKDCTEIDLERLPECDRTEESISPSKFIKAARRKSDPRSSEVALSSKCGSPSDHSCSSYDEASTSEDELPFDLEL